MKGNKDLIFTLKKKNAQYAGFNQDRIKKRARALENAGQFRAEEPNKQGIRARRGFKPTFGDLKTVKEVQQAEVTDETGKRYLTKLVRPIAETTNDTGPVRIEQQGSVLIDNTRRERLQSFANELVKF